MNLMAEIFVKRYEAVYKVDFQRAVKFCRYPPREAVIEISNAFDHFALAVRSAFEVDGREVPLPVDIILGIQEVPVRPKNSREDAYTNLLQAEKHLAVSRFCSLEHQIVAVIHILRGLIVAIPDDTIRANYRKSSEQLLNEFIEAPTVNPDAGFNQEQIKAELVTYNERCDALHKILARFLTLMNEINILPY